MVNTGYGLHLEMTNQLQNWLNYNLADFRSVSDNRLLERLL